MEQFQPTALCNVTYKVITKIMSNHLKNSLNQLIHLNQSAFIPNKSIIDNGMIDKVARNFWWDNTSNQRKLHLKLWDSLCMPKCSGGLGLRRFRDINMAFVTKLAWKVCTYRERSWAQLVRSKYLRGRRVLDFQRTTQSASWI